MIHKIFFSLLFICFSSSNIFASENNVENVFKIYSYVYNPLTEMYEPETTGSAVYLGDGKIITNAHVVVDENDNPYNYYEVCRTYSFRERPGCISVANLKHYDIEEDIAYLSINSSNLNLGSGVSWSNSDIDIGESITVLGYPGTGGETITLSEGKISGYVNGYYKTDSDIDAGNSGGGVFNESGDFVGMPTLIVSDSANLGYIIGAEDILNFIIEAQSQSSYSTDISDFKNLWNNHKTKLRNTQLLSIPGMQIRNPSMYNFEVLSYEASDNGLSEYFLKSTRGNTYIELGNLEVLQSDVSFTETWNGVESDEKRRVIKRELTLGGKNLTLLAYIDLTSQDIAMYFYAQSSSFSIYGNLGDSKAIIDALKMLISNTDILEQKEGSITLSYKGFQLTTQEQLFSSNELDESTISNYTEIGGNVLELSFEEFESDGSFDNIEGSYEDILGEYFSIGGEEEDGYSLTKSNLIKNKQGEIFILSEYFSTNENTLYYTLTKYSSLKGIDGYYYAIIAVPKEQEASVQQNLINFFDFLLLEGTDPVSVADQNSLKSVVQFFQ